MDRRKLLWLRTSLFAFKVGRRVKSPASLRSLSNRNTKAFPWTPRKICILHSLSGTGSHGLSSSTGVWKTEYSFSQPLCQVVDQKHTCLRPLIPLLRTPGPAVSVEDVHTQRCSLAFPGVNKHRHPECLTCVQPTSRSISVWSQHLCGFAWKIEENTVAFQGPGEAQRWSGARLAHRWGRVGGGACDSPAFPPPALSFTNRKNGGPTKANVVSAPC